MKPITLKMRAFGPYVEPVTLDFQEHLRDEKIFLIHGATGAGKTTILDAICYALYGETSGKARRGDDMRSQTATPDTLTEIDFSFELNGKFYKIHRTPAQEVPKKRGDGTTSTPAKAELYCDNNLICAKANEVTKKIEELLGFNAEQFRQVVMLPQGEFKKFLSADSDKRQEILNVLFDSSLYAKIEETLDERAKTSAAAVKELQNKRDDLERQLVDTGDETQSLSELTEKFSETQRQVDALKNIFDEAQRNLSDGQILSGKFKRLHELTATVAAAKAQFLSAGEKFKSAQAEHKLREGESQRRKELERIIAELKEISRTLAALKQREADLKTEREKLQAATDALAVCEAKTKSYAERLNLRKVELSRLFGADAKFVEAKQLLKRAEELKKLRQNISQLENSLDMEREKLSVVEENFKSAQIELNRLQIVHSAAHLATKLVDGEPCPVCGSTEHPKIIAEAIPTVDEINSAEKTLERLTKEKSQHERTISATEAKLDGQKNRLNDFDGVPDVPTAQKICDEAQEKSAALARCQQNIETGEQYIADNKAALDEATDKKNSASNAVARLEGEIAGLKQKVPEIYLSDTKKLSADLTAAQKESDTLDEAWKLAQDNFNRASKNYSACEAAFQTEQKNFNALNDELKDKTPPDIDELYRAKNSSSENYDASIKKRANLESRLNALKKISAELDDVKQKFDAAQKIADMWRRLSDVANATGRGEAELKISFQRYFLSTMFNEVVNEANNRLSKMSDGRYSFQMKDAGKTRAKSAGLNLEILDEYTGQTRPVETLSGGESFLASLSLALGLAAVVQNRSSGINLDTIFIDEGFGTLDSETLDFAISTIVEQSGGRLVGIISHVEDLKHQIPVRLEVRKTKSGSTVNFVS